MKSIVQERGPVAFPQHTGERIYMREFRMAEGLPFDLARWQPTVDAMLDGVDTDGPIYLMVDQGLVRAGAAHRRPGLHIDGYWNPAIGGHGAHIGKSAHNSSGGGRGSGHNAAPAPSGHRSTPRSQSHNYTPPADSHSPRRSHMAGAGGWELATYEEHEGILLASTVTAARAFAGEYGGAPRDGGDCAHIDVAGLREVILHAGTNYAGNVTMLHESLPVPVDCLRTVVRLNVPGWSPN